MQMRDWIAMITGLAIGAVGALPILNKMNVGPSWFMLDFLPVQIFAFLLAFGGLFLVWTSIIEITNSSSAGGISLIIALVVLIVGLIPLLHQFGIAPSWLPSFGLSTIVFQILFIIEGVFLLISGFAMEI